MASFDADIQLRVLTDKALKGIDEVERRISKIEDNSIDLRVKGLQQANRAVESLKKNLKTLGKIGVGALGVEGIGAASKAINELGNALASTEQASGLGSNAINAVLGPLQSLGDAAVQATGPLAGLFDGINSLAAAGNGTGLAIGAASAALVAFAGPIDAARKKVQELVLGVNKLDEEFRQLTDVKQAGRVGILGEIERQLSEARKEARELNSATDEYANTLRRVLQLEKERTSEIRKRTGLEAAERTRGAIDFIGTDALANVTQKALPSAELLAQRLKDSGQEVQRLSRYYGDLNTEIDKGTQDAAQFTSELQKAAERSRTLPPIFGQVGKSLEKIAKLTQDATTAQQKENQLLRQATELAKQTALQRQKDVQLRRDELAIQGRSINFERKLLELQEKRAKQQERSNNLKQNLAAGVGFPLLFGAGPGAIAGGALGSFGGFGPQILASAIGQQFDAFVAAVGEVAQAFSTAAPDIDKVSESLGVTGTAFQEYLQSLEDVGDSAKLNAEINRRLAIIVGQDGADALQKYGDDLTSLQRELSIFFTQLSAGFAELFGGVLKGIERTVAVSNAIRQAQNSGNPELQGALGNLQQAQRTPALQGGLEATIAAENELLRLVREINAEEERRAELLNSQGNSRLAEIALVEQELDLVRQGGDLSDEKVFNAEKELLATKLIVDQKALEAEFDKGKIKAQELVLKLKELELSYEKDIAALAERRQRLLDSAARDAERAAKAQQRDADRAAREAQRAAEREARRQEQQEKLYNGLKSQLEQQYAFAQDISDLERERLRIQFDYVKILERAKEIEDETLRTAVEKNALIVRDARLEQATRNAQEPLDNLKEELVFLREKLTLGEREAQIRKEIRDIEEATGGTVRAEAIEQEVRARADLNDQLTEQKALEEQIDALYKQLGSTVVSVFDDLINSTKSFNEILTDTLRQLSSFLLQAGFNAIGNSAGSGSLIGKLFGSRAMGGPVSAGQPYVVGERGPELFVPSQSGGVIANSKMGGGEVNYVQNIYITDSGSSSEGDAGELGRLIESSVVGIIQREKRPGGMLG